MGPAGSGKTFLMRDLIQEGLRYGWQPVVAAPTGRAARRLGQSTGLSAQTIHRLMYAKVESTDGAPMFTAKRRPLSPNHLLVIDEASMVGSKLYGELNQWLGSPARCRVLYVGDREQLEPVKDTWGPDLMKPTAALTQVHRQALGNPIISFATAIREGSGDAWMRNWNLTEAGKPGANVTFGRGYEHAIRWYLERRHQRDTTLITYTHDIRKLIATLVKQWRGATAPIAVGDRLLARVNLGNLDIMNGDVFTVTGVERADRYRTDWLRVEVAERQEPILVNLELFEQPATAFWQWRATQGETTRALPFVHVWAGEALTVHLAQGSQWDDVGYVWCDLFTAMRRKPSRRLEAKRFLYTAATRAVENLAMFVP